MSQAIEDFQFFKQAEAEDWQAYIIYTIMNSNGCWERLEKMKSAFEISM